MNRAETDALVTTVQEMRANLLAHAAEAALLRRRAMISRATIRYWVRRGATRRAK